jgi:hypothetical protein
VIAALPAASRSERIDAENPGTRCRVCSAARMPTCQAAGGDPKDAAACIAELNVALTVGTATAGVAGAGEPARAWLVAALPGGP